RSTWPGFGCRLRVKGESAHGDTTRTDSTRAGAALGLQSTIDKTLFPSVRLAGEGGHSATDHAGTTPGGAGRALPGLVYPSRDGAVGALRPGRPDRRRRRVGGAEDAGVPSMRPSP